MVKTFLVTGGAGFIGSNFIRYMLQHHQDISIINLDKLTYAGNLNNLLDIQDDPRYQLVKGDICDAVLVKDLFDRYQLDYVINFAAESHVDRSIMNPEVFLQTNVMGTLNLLCCAKQKWEIAENTYKENCKFIQVSTDEVYGSLGADGFFLETTPLDPHSPYSASKASADLLVKAYYETYGFPANITRCSNNYGPYQFPEKLIPLMICNALSHKSLPVYGDGMQVRDWIYVDDHCSAIDLVCSKGKAGEVYNIGGHNEEHNIDIVKKTIHYISQQIDEQVGQNLITYVADRKGHDRRYAIDPQKIYEQLGWTPQTKFDIGIEKTIQWYLDHPKWIENVTSGEYQSYYQTMYGLL